MVLGVCTLHAQPKPPTYPVIAGITVEGLSQGEDMQTVIAYSGLVIGKEAKPDDLVMAIRNLWNRRTFSDVRIIKERETALGVFLVIRVTPAPRLHEVVFNGLDELSRDDLMKVVDKRRGDLLAPADAYKISKAIKDKYAAEGMLFAKVETELTSIDSANYYDLTLNVNEGVKYSVATIGFVGNTRYTDAELAGAFSETKTKNWFEFWTSDDFDYAKYKADLKKLDDWFHEHGLLDAEVLHDTVMYDEATETVIIRITVNEGPVVHIRNVHFVGNTVYEEAELVRRLDIKPGDLYNGKKLQQNLTVNENQSDATSLYQDAGYLTANLRPELKRITDDTVDIEVRVTEGDRFLIRRVNIAGNTKTRDRVIRRELFTRPGDYFNRSAIIRSLRGLGVLNFFAPEKLNPQIQPVDKTHVDVTYNVEERSTDTFNASVGFAGAFGLTGSVGITLNNFDVSDPLRGGAGQIASIQWEFGQQSRLQTFQLSLTEPWLFGEPTTVGFNVFDTQQNFGFSIRRTGGQVNIGRRFRFPDDYFRGDWSVSFERQDVQSAGTFYRQGVNTALTLSQTISRTSYDNIIFPTIGSRFAFTVRGTTGFLGIGTTDFGKLGFNFDMVNPLLSIDGHPRLVMLVGSEIGYVDGLSADTTIPPQELFYMGGNGLGGFSLTPLRGYPDNSIGPLSGGRNVGGRMMARFLAEMRFALSLDPFPIYVLTFAEAGNVWANIRTVDPFGLKRAAGVGLRLLLNPIGLIGFDMGYGFDSNPFNPAQRSGWRFHFQFGR
jgi:outer membrane protein insertion porin family